MESTKTIPEDYIGLLSDQVDVSRLPKEPTRGCAHLHLRLSVVLNLVLGGVILIFIFYDNRSNGGTADITYSPASVAIETIPVLFREGFLEYTTPYQGWPTDTIDSLWEDLYESGASLHIPKDAASRLANKTEKFPVPGYEQDHLIGLDVFHQLHCLNLIRKNFYPERYNMSVYYANGTLNKEAWLHLDHCIDSIRQSLMCHVDVTPVFYTWMPRTKTLKPNLNAVHSCRNFSKIQQWAFERYVPDLDVHKRVENGQIIDYNK